MKISAVEAEVWRVPFDGELRPAWAPGVIWRDKTTTIYRVTTDDGVIGIGSGGGSPQFVRDRVAPRLIGEDPRAIGRLVRVMRNSGGLWDGLPVAFGLETALWDVVGKLAGLPLHVLWGSCTDRIRAYASLVEVRGPERRAEDVLALRDLGYTAVKLRLHSATISEDVAQVEAVRRAVGDGMEIMVDANQAQEPGTPGAERSVVWSYERALATCRELAQLGVAWVEEPLGRFDFDNLGRLTAATDVPIAGGENNVGLHEHRQLIDQNCYDVVQPDVAVTGGVGVLRKIAGYAEMRQKVYVPHHGGSGIGVATHLHLSAACANSPYVELLQEPTVLPAQRFQGVIREALVPDADGYVRLPEGPGLGVTLNEECERVG